MIRQPALPEPAALEYSVHACSSYSGQYGPENILVDDPGDQRSRWSGGSGFTSLNTLLGSTAGRAGSSKSIPASSAGPSLPSGGPGKDRQWLLLKLSRPAIFRCITFGKYARSHPCNVKEFKIYAGLSPDLKSMSLVHWGGLKNDPTPETFEVAFSNRAGVLRPTQYICIEPLSAHSSNYNISIWHIALAGNDDEALLAEVISSFEKYREDYTTKLILKHLRQRGMTVAFDAMRASLPSTSTLQFENPVVTELHRRLVQEGDFDGVEDLLTEIAFPASERSSMTQNGSLFDPFCQSASPVVQWTQLDTLSSTANMDCESPSARGGHQMVLVRNNSSSNAAATIEYPQSSHLYLFGGWNGTTELADLWRFDLQEQRWELLSPHTGQEKAVSQLGAHCSGPSARSCHQMAVDDETGDIYMLGQFVDASLRVNREDRGLAAPMSSTSTADAMYRGDSPMSHDTSSTHSSHENVQSSTLADFWVLHTRGRLAGIWEVLSTDLERDGGPKLIFDHQMQIDPTTRKLHVFGGKFYEPGNSIPSFSGLYSYDVREMRWTHIAADIDPLSINWAADHRSIPSRTGHSMLCDSAGRKIFILAGQRSDHYLSDMWTYNLDDGHIECLERDYGQSGGPEGGFTQRAVMDQGRREFVLLSGLMKEKSPPHFTHVKNTIWIYSLDTGRWRKIESLAQNSMAPVADVDDPKPRFAHQFVYDVDQDEYYLFGGNPAGATASARLDDFWRLKLLRQTHDDILMRCKFLVRRCKYYEMCDMAAVAAAPEDPEESPYMTALGYLQTELASVAGPSDQSEFLACMSYLIGGNVSTPARLDPKALSIQQWKKRTEVFEEILHFFPSEEVQPDGDLLSCKCQG